MTGLRPVLDLLRPVFARAIASVVRSWYCIRTWGMHPLHPDAGRIAMRRNLLLVNLERPRARGER